jgi:hypothetical protein
MRDRIKQRAEEREKQGGGGTKYNLPDGVNFFTLKRHAAISIVPYAVSVDDHPEQVPKGEDWYKRTVFVHYNVGAEEKGYLCLKTVKKKCPICEHRAEAMKQDKPDEKLLQALKPKEREIYNVYDHDDPDKGVQLWDYSAYLFQRKLEEELLEGNVDAGFAERDGGCILKLRASEKAMGQNKFMEVTRIDTADRDALDDDILSKALDLDTILKVQSYDDLERIFLELDDDPNSSGPAEVEDAPEKPQEERKVDPPKRSTTETVRTDGKREKPSAKSEVLTCPVKDGTFGTDCDEYDECKDCDLWERCVDVQEKQRDAGKKR